MTTPKTNGNGAKEVHTAQSNKTAINGKTNTAKAETTTTEAEVPKTEEKAAIPTPTIEVAATNPQPKTLEEQIKFFEGMEKLVGIRRRFETHKEAVQELEIADEELNKFETGNTYGARITLFDSNNKKYEITNPKLVKDMLTILTSVLDGKIAEYNTKIMEYGQQ